MSRKQVSMIIGDMKQSIVLAIDDDGAQRKCKVETCQTTDGDLIIVDSLDLTVEELAMLHRMVGATLEEIALARPPGLRSVP